jgi:hypothetical protein
MKSGTIKSAQRDACLPAGTASGVVRQLPLTGTLRLPAGRHGDSGVTPHSQFNSSPEAPASGRSQLSRTDAAPRREPGGSQKPEGSSPASYVERGAAVLCNIAEQTWILHRTHGTFVVAGRDPAPRQEPGGSVNNSTGSHSDLSGVHHNFSTSPEAPASGRTSPRDAAPYALTIISARTGAIDLGDKRTLEFPITAREIAEDLAREINSDGGEGSYFGVFVCKADAPCEAELLIAREQLAAFYRNLVAAADKEWERTHNVVFISDLQRRAARELKLEKEWSYEPQQRIDCPACGEKLKPGVAVCRVCGAVLDRAKAQQFGLGVPSEKASTAPFAP